jgi:hypothetical protein
MCCYFYRSPYRFQDAFVKAIQDDFKYAPSFWFRLTDASHSAMNESTHGGQITMKYRREKEVFISEGYLADTQSFYIVGDRESGKCEQAFVLSRSNSQVRFVKFLVNIKRMIERTV